MNTVPANELMTPTSRLMRADNLEQASKLFHEYDVVPSPRRGQITGYFLSSSAEKYEIAPGNLVSDRTEVLTLVELFSERQFFFVLSATTVAGFIHYSDLNKPVARIPVFGLYQHLERALWESIRSRISSDHLPRVFTPNEATRFVKRQRDAAKHNVDVGWTGVFSFPYILKLARFYGLHDLTDSEIKELKDIRNRLAHSDHNLVTGYDDVVHLAQVLEQVQSLLRRVRT